MKSAIGGAVCWGKKELMACCLPSRRTKASYVLDKKSSSKKKVLDKMPHTKRGRRKRG